MPLSGTYYITTSSTGTPNKGSNISTEDWLAYLKTDPELKVEFQDDDLDKDLNDPAILNELASDTELLIDIATNREEALAQGNYIARYLGETRSAEVIFYWDQGVITARASWADTAFFFKMIQIANALGAYIRNNDGYTYTDNDYILFGDTWSDDALLRKPIALLYKQMCFLKRWKF